MTETTIQLLWRDRRVSQQFRAGVSLHSHTMFSQESLEMVPRYTRRVPLLGQAVRNAMREFNDRNREELDFSRAFWTPPLSPQEAYRLERKQIEAVLSLPGFVSLTDHDDIKAGLHLKLLSGFENTPVSVEWTIPFGPTFFHLGIHNLPAANAAGIMTDLQAFTQAPEEHRLGAILEWLNQNEELLIVLNHPLWDEKGIGATEHAHVLSKLLEAHGKRVHALEVNGLRSWKENHQVIRMAEHAALPVVGGGDRHGLEPNAILNLSSASNFADFVHEVRYGRRSHVLFMPQYREPLKARVLQTMGDILREYPDGSEGRRHWSDRVYYRQRADSEPLPLSHFWRNGNPLVVELFVRAMRLVEMRSVRSALRLALNERVLWFDQEVAL
jgi:hypothetical protein